MKIKNSILFVLALVLLTSCKQEAEEPYISKAKDIETVFDNISVPPKAERESGSTSNGEEAVGEESSMTNDNDESTDDSSSLNDEEISFTDADEEEESDFAVDMKITTANVRFRMGPSSDYEYTETIPGGTEVEVLEEGLGSDGSWVRILYQGIEGFVSSELIEEIVETTE